MAMVRFTSRLWVPVFAFCVLYCFTLSFNWRAIERDVQAQAAKALSALGYDTIEVTSHNLGRGVLLSGVVPSSSDVAKIEKILAQVAGVSAVKHQLQWGDDAVDAAERSVSALDETSDEIAQPISDLDLALADANQCAAVFDAFLKDNNLNFAYNRIGLSDAHRAWLKQFAAKTAVCQGALIEVAGHTDSLGDRKSNRWLSQARAQAVADYLVVAGVAAEHIQVVGYGSSMPIASNDSPMGRAQNRRIEFSIIQ